MRYKINYQEVIFDDIEDVLDYCIQEDYHEDDDYFEEWVNDCYDRVTINGSTYYPFDILNELDFNNLQELKAQYCEESNETDRDQGRYELNRADAGDEVYIQGYEVIVMEDLPEATGDYDGDDELTTLRSRLEEIENIRKQQDETNKKEEQDLLQIIGE